MQIKLDDLRFEINNITHKTPNMIDVGIDVYKLSAYSESNEKIGHVTFEIMSELKNKQYENDEFFFDTTSKSLKPKPFTFYVEVNPEFRGQKIAGSMIKKVNEYCKNNFDSPIYSGTMNNKEAIKVWEKLVDEGTASENEYEGKIRWVLS